MTNNCRWCFSWLSTACSWKPLLVCALGLQIHRRMKIWLLTWVSPVFHGRLEVSIETYPWKLTGPVHNTRTRTWARPENAMLLNQRHDENRKSQATTQCTASSCPFCYNVKRDFAQSSSITWIAKHYLVRFFSSHGDILKTISFLQVTPVVNCQAFWRWLMPNLVKMFKAHVIVFWTDEKRPFEFFLRGQLD